MPKSHNSMPLVVLWQTVAVALIATAMGCGHGNDGSGSAGRQSEPVKRVESPRETPVAEVHEPAADPPEQRVFEPEASPQIPQRTFLDLAKEAEKTGFEPAPVIPPTAEVTLPDIDEERVAASGIRKVEGQHLTLYTDLPSAAAIDELPVVFDAAVPTWVEYFQIDTSRTNSWQMVGYLMQDKQRFRSARLLPDDLPPFLHGYQRGTELWLYEQPSDYYRRHLLLHEGTHGFMKHFLGGAGPPWYMEGTAELLGTHRWERDKLTLRWFPRDKEATPHWGRIKVIKQNTQAGRGMSLEKIFHYDASAHLNVEPYAWCWAAAAFFDGHPEYRDAFRELRRFAPDASPVFSERFYESLREEWPQLTRQWHVFLVNMEYGFDVEREAIVQKESRPLPAAGATVEIAVDRGWQSTGYVLEAGTTYHFEASGRYQIGDKPEIWWCEPNGVTIRYYQGLPLGILIGAVVDEQAPIRGTTTLARPDPIGLSRDAPVKSGGTLYLRINDSPAELDDNAGSLEVRIVPVE